MQNLSSAHTGQNRFSNYLIGLDNIDSYESNFLQRVDQNLP